MQNEKISNQGPGILQERFTINIKPGYFRETPPDPFDEDIARFCLNLAINQGMILRMKITREDTTVLIGEYPVDEFLYWRLVRDIAAPLVLQLDERMKELYGQCIDEMIDPVTKIVIKKKKYGDHSFLVSRKAGEFGKRKRHQIMGRINLKTDADKEDL